MNVPSTEGSGSQYILSALKAARDTPRLKKAANSILFGVAVYEVTRTFRKKVKQDLTHTVSLIQDDEIYDDVQEWLISNIPSGKRRSLSARSYRGSTEERHRSTALRAIMNEWDANTKRREGKIALFYDGSREQTVYIEGHRIRVSVDKEEKKTGNMSREVETIKFTAHNVEGRDAIIEFLRKLAFDKHSDGHARLFIADRYGDWSVVETPPRPLDTVILREGQMEDLTADLSRFLENEESYTRMGIPWHRGYLFHGPPGTGKTSLAKALAEHFEMDIYYIPLSDLDKDGDLLNMLRRVQPRSILILEDVDVVHASKSRDDAESAGISLSGLLNALDGMVTPHGMVTIMTTNNLDALDSALRRAGRADRVEELGYLDDEQLGRLVKMIADVKPTTNWVKARPELTHAEVVESVKRVIGDTDAMKDAVREVLCAKSKVDAR